MGNNTDTQSLVSILEQFIDTIADRAMNRLLARLNSGGGAPANAAFPANGAAASARNVDDDSPDDDGGGARGQRRGKKKKKKATSGKKKLAKKGGKASQAKGGKAAEAAVAAREAILALLMQKGPMRVTQIVKVTNIPQVTVNKRLNELKDAKLVTTVRDGTRVLYKAVHDGRAGRKTEPPVSSVSEVAA